MQNPLIFVFFFGNGLRTPGAALGQGASTCKKLRGLPGDPLWRPGHQGALLCFSLIFQKIQHHWGQLSCVVDLAGVETLCRDVRIAVIVMALPSGEPRCRCCCSCSNSFACRHLGWCPPFCHLQLPAQNCSCFPPVKKTCCSILY